VGDSRYFKGNRHLLFFPFWQVYLPIEVPKEKFLYITLSSRMRYRRMFAFCNRRWQIYVLVFLMNVFNAFFFSPTLTVSIIPSNCWRKEIMYRQSDWNLSAATYPTIGVLGSGTGRYIGDMAGCRKYFLLCREPSLSNRNIIVGAFPKVRWVTQRQDDWCGCTFHFGKMF